MSKKSASKSEEKVVNSVSREPIAIDLMPILEFQYCQISNFDFNYLLLDENNKALHTPFECKDYLQDMFWTEHTGKSADVYGIKWEKGRINMSQEFFKLAMLGANGHNLSARIELMETWLNHFDKALGFKPTVVVPSTNAEYIVVNFSKEWVASPLLLSAYTTLIRISGDYQGEEPVEYLKRLLNTKGHTDTLVNYMRKDVNRMEGFVYKLAALLQGKLPTRKWEDSSGVQETHNHGIHAARPSEFPSVTLE